MTLCARDTCPAPLITSQVEKGWDSVDPANGINVWTPYSKYAVTSALHPFEAQLILKNVTGDTDLQAELDELLLAQPVRAHVHPTSLTSPHSSHSRYT